jgi:hypothetical protein
VWVHWWASPEACAFPINVDQAARLGLPLTPGKEHPGESELLSYYQGKIDWEDLFPPPEGFSDGEKKPAQPGNGSGVDTSRIQSYQIREFVEALRGIQDDLRHAAGECEQSIRMALVGAVSPVGLARSIWGAVEAGTRTPVAAGFQFVEILAVLENARSWSTKERCRAAWNTYLNQAIRTVKGYMKRLRARADMGTSFARYQKRILTGQRRGGS